MLAQIKNPWRSTYRARRLPARKVKRIGVKMRELKLPETDQFQQLLENLEHGGGRSSRHGADLVRFLAFSGCRLSEAKGVTWNDVVLDKATLKVRNAKQRATSGAEKYRTIPIISELRSLLERLAEPKPAPEEPVCRVHECEKSLTRACWELKISHITHHDLRHLFSTRCIESGADIPTVSRWLGHVYQTATVRTEIWLYAPGKAPKQIERSILTDKNTPL